MSNINNGGISSASAPISNSASNNNTILSFGSLGPASGLTSSAIGGDATQQQHPQNQTIGIIGGGGSNSRPATPSRIGDGVVGSSTGTPGAAGSTPSTSAGNNTNNQGVEELLPLVMQLTNPDQREGVLLELSKKRESFSDLAPVLWHSFGTVAALLQEIVSIYPLLSPPNLTAHCSNRVCNALALLQCVASHPETRGLFLAAHVPLYLYPFLNTSSKNRPFEYLRLTSLGVVGALVKMDDSDVINFLLQTEIIPLCLRIMETGSELSKTVATFIVQKILLDEIGLSYICATAERFYAVSTVLSNMVSVLIHQPSVRLLKHIVRCYLRLSDNSRAREALRQSLPGSLRDETFNTILTDDATVKKWLMQLLNVVGPPNLAAVPIPSAGGGNPGAPTLSGLPSAAAGALGTGSGSGAVASQLSVGGSLGVGGFGGANLASAQQQQSAIGSSGMNQGSGSGIGSS